VLAILFRFATVVGEEVDVSEVLNVLAETLRAHFRSAPLKTRALAALGECMFFVTSHPTPLDCPPPWTIPAAVFALLKKCLRLEEVWVFLYSISRCCRKLILL
jgi:hypothetical protein